MIYVYKMFTVGKEDLMENIKSKNSKLLGPSSEFKFLFQIVQFDP